jgi:hypothetical protein
MNTAEFKFAPPTINVLAVHNDDELLEAVGKFDLVIVTKMQGRKLPSYAQTLDSALDGVISRTTELVGPRGSHRLIWLEQYKPCPGWLKYLFVVGLGHEEEYDAKATCGLVQTILQESVVLGAKTVALLVSPHRLTEEGINLKGTAAVIRCRAEAFASRARRCMPDELTLICSPQAHRHLVDGLAIAAPRCRFCTSPSL